VKPEPTVLVVDDSDDHRFIASTELKRLKTPRRLRIDDAATGEEALAKVEGIVSNGGNVLVLSDYRMPSMGGIELVKAIRARWRPTQVKVIVYSSTDQGIRAESLASGADGFMIKPMDLVDFRRELSAAVNSFLNGSTMGSKSGQ
jgi:CheY-like chemotaxis protein